VTAEAIVLALVVAAIVLVIIQLLQERRDALAWAVLLVAIAELVSRID
jgi:hypothetical protein